MSKADATNCVLTGDIGKGCWRWVWADGAYSGCAVISGRGVGWREHVWIRCSW